MDGELQTKLAEYLAAARLIAHDANFRVKAAVAVAYFSFDNRSCKFMLVDDLVETEIAQRAFVLSLGLALDAVNMKGVVARAYLSHIGLSHDFLADRTHRLAG